MRARSPRQRLVRLVDDQQEVFRKVIEQGLRRSPRRSPRQVARVVLDARAEAHLLHQLEVVLGALLEPLLLEKAALLVVEIEALAELLADRLHGAAHLRLRRDVVRAGKDRVVVDRLLRLALHRVDLADGLDRVAEVLDPDRGRLLIGREDLDHVASHPEGTAVKVDVVALVLHVDQAAQQLVARQLFADPQLDGETTVALDVADAVDAAHRGDDDHVGARQQRLGGGVAHPVDGIVDDGVLLDERVGRRDVGLGLVVVVERDEVLDRVVRKELAHLAKELRGQRLVRGHDQRRPLQPLDHLRHRERLARASHTEQRLVGQPALEPVDQFFNRTGLIALRLELGHHLEGSVHGSLGLCPAPWPPARKRGHTLSEVSFATQATQAGTSPIPSLTPQGGGYERGVDGESGAVRKLALPCSPT